MRHVIPFGSVVKDQGLRLAALTLSPAHLLTPLRALSAVTEAYLINAYRVLLTRARQGMILCVPKGSKDDPTRLPEFYDSTYEYLKSLGIEEL